MITVGLAKIRPAQTAFGKGQRFAGKALQGAALSVPSVVLFDQVWLKAPVPVTFAKEQL